MQVNRSSGWPISNSRLRCGRTFWQDEDAQMSEAPDADGKVLPAVGGILCDLVAAGRSSSDADSVADAKTASSGERQVKRWKRVPFEKTIPPAPTGPARTV